MGYTEVRTHIKINTKYDIKKKGKYYEGNCI